ncbi:MAG: ATP-binding cassette domain-containing protein [Acidobacteriota bacterium]
MSIILENLTKRYGNQFVVDNLSLEITDGELFVLLGSSGSGKSTILRLIAGLTEPTEGHILLHGKDVTYLTPQERGTGFVFQNYSIFRHLSVSENIEFGLKIRKTPRAERVKKREQLLEMVGLAGLGSRYAHQLSGGQQQRVALARALAYEPNVLLLDEPFGALDVKIRAQLRRSLKEIQRRLGVTTILVTHDQEEAFELADRIGVLERGRLLEVDTGENLYACPRTLFAATFLGAGTVLVGRVEQGKAKFGTLNLPLSPEIEHKEGERVQVLFRPEQVKLFTDEPNADLPVIGKGEIIEDNFTGALRRLRLRLPHLTGTRQLSPVVPFGEEDMLVDAAVAPESGFAEKAVYVGLRDWTILKPSIPRLLVCDFGEGLTVSLSAAKILAQQMGALITVLAVADNPEIGERFRSVISDAIEQQGLAQADVHIRYGNLLEQLAIEQAESFYEMLIVSAKSRIKNFISGNRESTSRQPGELLLNELSRSDMPILVVKEELTTIRHLLICTAAGEPGKSDVRVGGQLARRLGATVTLFYVTRGAAEPDTLVRNHLERAAATLRTYDVESRVRYRQAHRPAEGIVAEAHATDYDLIVMGSSGARKRAFFGMNNVTKEAFAGTPKPVLIVPAEE